MISLSGFLDMLTRAQCYRVDDQRGLLTKEQLEIPSFLQLPSDQGQDTEPEGLGVTSSHNGESKEVSGDKTSLPSSPAGAAEGAPNSAESKSKDLRETDV